MELAQMGIGLGTSIFGGIMGSRAAKNAANQQAAAYQQAGEGIKQAVAGGRSDITAGLEGANATLRDSTSNILGMYQPYTQAGLQSLGSVQQLLSDQGPLTEQFSFKPTDLQHDPGYQFSLQQGQEALQRAAAAKGGLFSGATMKSLAGYTTGAANQYFGDAFNRAAQTFSLNRQNALQRVSGLQDLAKMGFGATGAGAGAYGDAATRQANNQMGAFSSLADLGMKGAGMQADMITGQGNAQAAGTMGAANAWSKAISGAGNSIQGMLAGRRAKNTPYYTGGGNAGEARYGG